nr:zinc ABC transporter substrate-binding protein [Clostridia bacterium]
MRKCLIFLILVLSFSVLLAGCGTDREAASSDENGSANEESIKNGDQKSNQIIIVATLFPQYDFARQIAGDKAEVTLLLPPGVESHSYEPTPSDIIRINESDLFIYTGKNMEAWSQKIIDGMVETGSKSLVLDVSRGIKLETTETLEEDHEHLYDPHIWTDPLIAKEMVSNIETALCQLDPVNAEYYKENAEAYRM